MTLEELGKIISEKREQLGLSVDDVAASIKVSVRTLRAIENGSLQGLPNAVYTKGFIRSYALLVKVDAETLNAALQDIFPPEAFDDAAPQMSTMLRPLHAAEMKRRFAALLLLVLVLVALGSAGWFVFSRYGEDLVDLVKKPFSAISPVASEIPLVAAANASSVEPASAVADSSVSLALSAPVASPEAAPVALPEEASGGAPAAAEPANSVPSASLVAEGPTPLSELEKKTLADKKHIVRVEAKEDCYLGITADNEKLVHQMVHASEVHEIVFQSSLKLLVGNAGGITLRYDGNDLGEIGAKAKPKLLVFPLPSHGIL